MGLSGIRLQALTFAIRSGTGIDACLICILPEVNCLFHIGPFEHQLEIMGSCTTLRYDCGKLLHASWTNICE